MSRILAVDSDEETHVSVNEMLAGEGHTIDHACNGNDAWSMLREIAYDLVLTDIRVGGLDGLTLLKRVHEERPASKVVIMTAESSPATVIDAIRDDAFSYLGKPLTRVNLVETIRAALDTVVEPGDIEVISAQANWVSLRLRCKMATADRLAQFFRELVVGLSPDDRDSISTAVRELLMNAIEHGCHSDPGKKVSLSYVRMARSIVFYIRDPGEGFSIEDLPHAAVSNSPEQPFEHTEVRNQMGIRPGGFGILLTKNFADELVYSEKGNEVILIKYLS